MKNGCPGFRRSLLPENRRHPLILYIVADRGVRSGDGIPPRLPDTSGFPPFFSQARCPGPGPQPTFSMDRMPSICCTPLMTAPESSSLFTFRYSSSTSWFLEALVFTFMVFTLMLFSAR